MNLINDFKPNKITVAGKWVLMRKLGEGSFGEIYEGKNIIDENERVAVKLVFIHNLFYISSLFFFFLKFSSFIYFALQMT